MNPILTLVLTGALALETFAAILPPSNLASGPLSASNLPRLPRQIADEDDIDTDGPFGYVPRVVHGVNKIVKGLVNGNVHSIFQGAFGIAPDDVAEDLVGTYNQIMGIPDPDDLPDKDETTEKGVTKKPAKPVKAAAGDKTKVAAADKVKGQAAAGSSKVAGNQKKPLAPKVEEDDRDEEEDEEEDDI